MTSSDARSGNGDVVIGVLLAAGSSARFGQDKLTFPLADGCSIGVRAAQHLIAALPHTIAIVGALQSPLAEQLAGLGCRVIANPQARSGMASSLTLAIRGSTPSVGWVVALADMPWIRPATIAAVANRLDDGASLVAPFFSERRGHPVGLAAHWREALLRLRGDQGARTLLRTHAASLSAVRVPDPGVLRDIDVPHDLSQPV